MAKSLIGSKINSIKKSLKMTDFYLFLDVSKATYSNYLNGTTKPDIEFLMRLSNKVARTRNGQLIDMNWLIDDFDHRQGPVFIGKNASSQAEKGAPEALVAEKPKATPASERPIVPPGSRRMDVRKSGKLEWWEDPIQDWTVRGAGAADSSNGLRIPGHDDLDSPEHPPEGLTLVPVEGDSMVPVLLSGQYAMIDKDREGFEADGRIVVMVVAKNEVEYGTYIKRCFREGEQYILESMADYDDIRVPVSRCLHVWTVIGTWYAGKGKVPERKNKGNEIAG